MYSMVLMAALTTGTDMPDLGRRGGGCCGCYGGMSWGGCYGGGWGGCYGGGWGGCRGGGWGGCYGGGCWGGGYAMSYGCGGGYGGYSWGGMSPGMGYAYMPMTTYGSTLATPLIAGNILNGAPGTTQSFFLNPATQGSQATIIVHLPENATLTFDGEATQSRSGTRTFVSPPLDQGKTYTYTLRGEMNRNGRKVNARKTIEVRAGKTTEVNLNFPDSEQERGRSDSSNSSDER
jgi:uncharacterized protein (TIGR03000 family)